MANEFTSIFRALTGYKPFLWQERLFDELKSGRIPSACDIPTGLGKTSVMAIWLAALDLRAPGPLPRRLVYVVDRRAVVDQATEEAEKLTRRLGNGKPNGEVQGNGDKPDAEVIARLRVRLQLDAGQSLAVSTLRGQHADNRAWLDDPSAPAIVVGTVDMIGSRLLFSGYGVSRRQRPVHAALLGADALVLLDEAHLVPPFQALVEQVAERTKEASRHAAESAVVSFAIPPMRVMALSATGRTREKHSDVFRLEQADIDGDDMVRKRVTASKQLRLESEPTGDLADAMATRAWQLADNKHRVIVFCNSRKMAEQVHASLAAGLKKSLGKDVNLDRHLELIVGARRVRERELLAESHVFRRFAILRAL
jgi:CRISPR-associated endonuclease/helicase Cas3